jgi:predicted small secreted protein
MFKKASFLAIAAAFLLMTGCNTVEGVGKDVQRGGEKIENAADKAKK